MAARLPGNPLPHLPDCHLANDTKCVESECGCNTSCSSCAPRRSHGVALRNVGRNGPSGQCCRSCRESPTRHWPDFFAISALLIFQAAPSVLHQFCILSLALLFCPFTFLFPRLSPKNAMLITPHCEGFRCRDLCWKPSRLARACDAVQHRNVLHVPSLPSDCQCTA